MVLIAINPFAKIVIKIEIPIFHSSILIDIKFL